MITVKITQEVKPSMISDAICTAFESGAYGCRYWMPIARPPSNLNMTEEEAKQHCNWYSMPRTWEPGHQHVVRFWELIDEFSGKMKIHWLDVDTIAERLQVVADKDPELFGEFMNSDDEPLDGPSADAFLQLLLLGEVVYG